MLSFGFIKAVLFMGLVHTHPNSSSIRRPLRIWGHYTEAEEIHRLLILLFSIYLFLSLIEREICALKLIIYEAIVCETEQRCLCLLVDQRSSRYFFPFLWC